MSDSMRTPSATPARAPIPRAPLRAEVRRALIETLTRGDPPPGTPLSEPALAAGLGISRTPLREALLGLAHEGLLETTPGRGFSVAPVNYGPPYYYLGPPPGSQVYWARAVYPPGYYPPIYAAPPYLPHS